MTSWAKEYDTLIDCINVTNDHAACEDPQDHFLAALAQARADGREEALLEAALIADRGSDIAERIRSLLRAPPEGET